MKIQTTLPPKTGFWSGLDVLVFSLAVALLFHACMKIRPSTGVNRYFLGSNIPAPLCIDLQNSQVYFLENEELKCLNYLNNEKDSIQLPEADSKYISLASWAGGVATISFAKENQYIENEPKKIKVGFYDPTLRLLDSVILVAPAPCRLVKEDFSFTSLYFDRMSRTVWFNDAFSCLFEAKNGVWNFKSQPLSTIDPVSGLVYQLKHNDSMNSSKLVMISNGRETFLKEIPGRPTQFSVMNNWVGSSWQGKLYYGNLANGGPLNSIKSHMFHPCLRTQNGFYNIRGDSLFTIFISPVRK